MHMEAMIMLIWRPWSSDYEDEFGGRDEVELRNALTDGDWAISEIHLDAKMQKLRDAHGGHNRESLEMHWEVMITRT